MKNLWKYFCADFSYVILSAFLLFAVFNPVFKKYDYGAEYPLVLLFGVMLVILAIVEFKRERERSLMEKIFLLIFTGGVVLSFIFSQTKNVGFSEVLAFCSIVPLYFIFAHKKIEFLWKFLQVIGVCAVLAIALGYFLYFYWPENRMFGPFFNILSHSNVWPNAFALFLLLVWPLFLLFRRGKSQFFKTSVFIGILFSGLLLTYSRGALIVLLGQGLLLLIYFFRKIRIKTVLLALISIAVAFFLFFGANYIRGINHDVISIKERVAFDNSESLTSKQERIDFWKGAIELIKQKPLLGWGPFSFREAYNGIQKTLLGNSDHPHNLFLKIGAENGLIALGAFIAFLLSVFIIVASRFSTLEKNKKDIVYILSVCAAGGFAHNLIDYNLNFFSNLLILFIFIIFIRSLVVTKTQIKKEVWGLVLAIIIGLFSLYEGAILILSKTVDESYLEYSFYPRDYYLTSADAEKQISLNPLSSKAFYLLGVVDSDKNYFKRAIELNPLNDFSYYREYFRLLAKNEKYDLTLKIAPLLKEYFSYVDNNVHFTAYTSNVEEAADLVDLILPYLSADDVRYFSDKKQKMLNKALELRALKKY